MKAEPKRPYHVQAVYDLKPITAEIIFAMRSASAANHPELTIRSEDYKEHLAIETLLYTWVIVSRFHPIAWMP